MKVLQAMMVPVCLLAVVLLLGCVPVRAFKWHLTDVLPGNEVLQFSERYMFASGEGPEMLEQGEAYIQVDTDLLCYMSVNRSSTIGYAIYATDEGHHHETLRGMCTASLETSGKRRKKKDKKDDSGITQEEELVRNTWAMNVVAKQVKTKYVKTIHLEGHQPPLFLNGTYFLYKAAVDHKYEVKLEAWHNVAFQLCEDEILEPQAHVDGMLSFKNPYGYLPGELFGFLPFEAARMVAYFLFACFYLIQYCRYRESALSLHLGILFVFLVGLVESTMWYAAYESINLSGEPYCCPFPSLVVVAFVLQVFRQTFSRLLLLVVALGFGIVRPRLLPSEWVSITIVGTLYFISAIVGQVSEVVLMHDVHPSKSADVLIYQVPLMIMDVICLSWIYLALGSTIRILGEYRQTVKLEMFSNLARAIGFFVTMFTIVTLLVLADKNGTIRWPWQYLWAQNVSWEVLNFLVIATVSIICMPSPTSKLLSYAHQLPTDDPDADDQIDSLDDSALDAIDEEYDEEDGDVEMSDVTRRGGDAYTTLPGAGAKNPLRDADEDEEY